MASIFGQSYKHIVVLLILMLIDTIFGWVKGFKQKNWTSKRARWGATGKIVELILISLLYMVDWIFGLKFTVQIGLYYFIIVEIASIIENYTGINDNLPKGFTELLVKIKFNIGTSFVKKVKSVIELLFKSDDKGDEKK